MNSPTISFADRAFARVVGLANRGAHRSTARLSEGERAILGSFFVTSDGVTNRCMSGRIRIANRSAADVARRADAAQFVELADQARRARHPMSVLTADGTVIGYRWTEDTPDGEAQHAILADSASEHRAILDAVRHEARILSSHGDIIHLHAGDPASQLAVLDV